MDRLLLIVVLVTGSLHLVVLEELQQKDAPNSSNDLVNTIQKGTTKSRTLFDYQTRVVAYKDLIESRCLLEFLKNGESVVNRNQRDNLPSNFFLSENKLTKRQIYSLGGQRISEFCRGFPTYLIQDQKTYSLEEDNLPMDDEPQPHNKVVKRQTKHFFVGRVRGQTQSQYLNVGNNGQPGTAEAESTYGGSKAVVSGTSGMGQAQSQSSPYGCEDCNGGINGGNGGGIYEPGRGSDVEFQQPGSEPIKLPRPIGPPSHTSQPGYPTYPGQPSPGNSGQNTYLIAPGYPKPALNGQPTYSGQPTLSIGHPGQPGQPYVSSQPSYNAGHSTSGYPGQPLTPGHTAIPSQASIPGHTGIPDRASYPGQPSEPGHSGTPGGSSYAGPASIPAHTSVPGGPSYSRQPSIPGAGQSLYPGQSLISGHGNIPGQPQYPNQPSTSGLAGIPGHVSSPEPAGITGQPLYDEHPSIPGQPPYTALRPAGIPSHPGQTSLPHVPGQSTYPSQQSIPSYITASHPDQPTHPIPPGFPSGPSYLISPGYPGQSGVPSTYPGYPSPPTSATQPLRIQSNIPGTSVSSVGRGKFDGSLAGNYEAHGGDRGRFSGRFSGEYESNQGRGVNGGITTGHGGVGDGSGQSVYPGSPGYPTGTTIGGGSGSQLNSPRQPGYPSIPGQPSPEGGGTEGQFISSRFPDPGGASGSGLTYPTGPVGGTTYAGRPGIYPSGPVGITAYPSSSGGGTTYPAGSAGVYPSGSGGITSYPMGPGGITSHSSGPNGGTNYPAGPVVNPSSSSGITTYPTSPGGGLTYPSGPGGGPYPSGSGGGTTYPSGPGGINTYLSSPGGAAGYPSGPGGGITYPSGTGGVTTYPSGLGGETPYPLGSGGGVNYPAGPAGIGGYPSTTVGVSNYPGAPVSYGPGIPGYPGGPSQIITQLGGAPGGTVGTGGTVGGYFDQNGNWISTASDDSDSQAETSVHQTNNETQAVASAQGKHAGGTAQSQVSGTYSGSGSFSASAGSDDGKRGALTEVSGGKEGASSSAQGRGGVGRSQTQVQLSSDTGDTVSSSQTGGYNHGSQTQVQASSKGGMADAQSNGPGSTSSQAQIGFTPYDENEEVDDQTSPFRGGGQASAQSGTYSGQAQSQIQGKFHMGIRYAGAAQAGSGNANSLAGARNQSRPTGLSGIFPTIKPITYTSGNSGGSIQSRTHKVSSPVSPPSEFSTSQPKSIGRQPTDVTLEASTLDSDATDDYDEEEYGDGDYGDDTTEKVSTRSRSETHLPARSQPQTTIVQSSKTQSQHIALGQLEDLDATIHQSSGDDFPKDGTILQPGQRVPGSPGYQIPTGFRGRVKSISNGPNTYSIGRNSQAQSATLSPGTGRIIYRRPIYAVGSNTQSHNGQYGYGSGYTYQVKSGKSLPNFVSSTKSETGSRNLYTGKKIPSVYYSQSSTCGVFTNSCVFNGSGKICYPKPKTNPDGSLMAC